MRTAALETLVGSLTISELAAKCNRSVDQIVAFAMDGAAKGSAPRQSAPSRNGASAELGHIYTRSAKVRAAYEEAVYGVVARSAGNVAAQEIRKEVGGTPQQARAALNRLIADGRLTYEGRARATRYSVA